MKRRFSYVTTSIACFIGALCCGCAVTPGGNAPAINDAVTTADAAFATTSGLALLGAQYPTEQVPAAKAIYETASAVNAAAKNGVSLSEIETLAQTYLNQADPQYSALVGELIQMVELNVQAVENPSGSTMPAAPSTQPSSGISQELLVDLTQGIMNGALVYAGAMPTAATMGVENRGRSSIVVTHFVWTSDHR